VPKPAQLENKIASDRKQILNLVLDMHKSIDSPRNENKSSSEATSVRRVQPVTNFPNCFTMSSCEQLNKHINLIKRNGLQ